MGLPLLALCLGVALVASLAVGAAGLPIGEVIATLAGRGDDTSRAIIFDLRLPRAVLGTLVGAALAVSGAVFQALLRNPLAEPYVLGVSGGAAVGAVGAVVLGWSARSAWALPLAAFAGALLAIVAVLRITARVARTLDVRVLLLTGVIVGAFFNAIILLFLTFTDVERFRSAVFWLMGGLAGATWSTCVVLAAYLLPAAVVLVVLARPLNALAVSEETALYLGIPVARLKLAAYLVTSLLVAASVAVSGIVGFVGLIVPHGVRLVWGSEHRVLLPAALLAGGGFVLVADSLARTLAAPAELPLGVVTALVGVPLFVVLLKRSAGREAGASSTADEHA
jgi:iron complex transport system permease protein